MSQENLELWREGIEGLLACTSESDWDDWIARMPEWLHPEIEWDATDLEAPGAGGVYRGIDAVQRFWREWFAAWQTLEFEYELVDAGDHVVLLVDQRMRGRSTGIEVSLGPYAHVATFRDGLMFPWKLYGSPREALASAGWSDSAKTRTSEPGG
jgi:hypothetical protein